MQLCRTVGLLVATPKAAELEGLRFALVQPLGAGLSPRGRPQVAVDTVGAAEGQLIVTVAAGPARSAAGMAGRPVDLAVVGIVDAIAGGAEGEAP